MKIGMVLDSNFPPDIRVENEAVCLVENGHEVHLLCFDFSVNYEKYEVYRGINIHRLYKHKEWVKKGKALTNTFLNFYPHYWKKKIIQFALNNEIEVLHIHDLHILGAAISANKNLNLPIVSDLHENYPEALKYYKFANTFPGNLIISKKKWAYKEKEWCTKADYIITVIEEAIQRYGNIGIPEEKITVIQNYVNEGDFLKYDEDQDILQKYRDKFVAIYVGAFDTHRGLESVIKALPEVVKEIPDFLLVLVGRGSNYSSLQKLAQELSVSNYVVFEGFQPQEKIPSYIIASSIGLIPHLKTAHTDNTIPHKLFHYMLMNKPVVAANCNPIERILNESNAGLIYRSNNEKELADKIIQLYKNNNLRIEMGENGKKAVLEKYNWSITIKNLTNLYKNIEFKITQNKKSKD